MCSIAAQITKLLRIAVTVAVQAGRRILRTDAHARADGRTTRKHNASGTNGDIKMSTTSENV